MGNVSHTTVKFRKRRIGVDPTVPFRIEELAFMIPYRFSGLLTLETDNTYRTVFCRKGELHCEWGPIFYRKFSIISYSRGYFFLYGKEFARYEG